MKGKQLIPGKGDGVGITSNSSSALSFSAQKRLKKDLARTLDWKPRNGIETHGRPLGCEEGLAGFGGGDDREIRGGRGEATVKSMHRVDAVGNSPGVCRKLTEGIGSLLGWRKGVRQKKTETRQKIIGGSRKAYRDLLGDSPKESGRSLGTRREITRKKTRGLAEGCRIM
ncbi:hypothetical protein B296_00034329 [Ensete ventricosum]|uniref:Uncharacterized protein n=1 Tax=Ensete ventricosum TaxID=4639 RepID=A0A426XN13_ENSVE|nr:hypothetical protein B296_00034329 [Ensete ventricosum]